MYLFPRRSFRFSCHANLFIPIINPNVALICITIYGDKRNTVAFARSMLVEDPVFSGDAWYWMLVEDPGLWAGQFRNALIVKSKNIQDPGSANAGNGFRRNGLDSIQDFMQL